MSQRFQTSGDTLKATSNVTIRAVGTGPVSIAFWFRPTSLPANAILGLLAIVVANSKHYSCRVKYTSERQLSAFYNDQSTTREQFWGDGTSAWSSSDIWHHIAVCFPNTGAVDYLVWYDGAPRTPLAVGSSGSPATFTPDQVWWQLASANANVFAAEGGMWNDTLADADVVDLYTNKYSPILVKNSTLQHAYSLETSHANNGKNDQKGTAHLSTTAGSPATNADHPSGMVYSLGGGTIGFDDDPEWITVVQPGMSDREVRRALERREMQRRLARGR